MSTKELIKYLSTLERYHVRVTQLTINALRTRVKEICDLESSTLYNELRQVLKDGSNHVLLDPYDKKELLVIRKYFFCTGFNYVLPAQDDHNGERLYYLDEIDPKYYNVMKAIVSTREIDANLNYLKQYQEEHKARKELKELKPKTKVNTCGKAYKSRLASIKYFQEMTLEEFKKFSRSNMIMYSSTGSYYNFYEMKYEDSKDIKNILKKYLTLES